MSTITAKPRVSGTALSGDDFPVINFSNREKDPKGIAAEIFNAAREWGFLVLKGHGIPSEAVDEMFGLVCYFELHSMVHN